MEDRKDEEDEKDGGAEEDEGAADLPTPYFVHR